MVDELEALACKDQYRVHELVGDPRDADVILFVQCHMVDWRLRAIREHRVARAHWDRVMVYDERDRHWRSFPGIYVSTPGSRFDPKTQRAWGYIRVPSEPAEGRDPDLLFSFIGSVTAPCRRRLLELRHPDAIIEQVRDFMFWDDASPDHQHRRQHYREVLARSRFVLCPRGIGTSSFRLYETLAAGRVPVILADGWVAPDGPDWDSFSLRVGEGNVAELIPLLESRLDDWPDMSAAALHAHEHFFADTATFHRIGELAADLSLSSPPRLDPAALGRRALLAAARESAGRRLSSTGIAARVAR